MPASSAGCAARAPAERFEPSPPAVTTTEYLKPDELRDAWPMLSAEERIDGFRLLATDDAQEFFLAQSPRSQTQVLAGLEPHERRLFLSLLAPDDAADVLQEVPPEERAPYLNLLDGPMRREVIALLAYAEDDAGGLMSPRFARIRPDMTVDEAISYLRRQARNNLETIYYAYVLDGEQRLLGVTSFRQLFLAPSDKLVREIIAGPPITVPEDMDQEAVAKVIAQHDLLAVPVVDGQGRMKGIVSVDDIVDVVQEEATEDIQKMGGVEALDAPYLQTRFGAMFRKRAGWLAVLFFGEMLTASAMGNYQRELERAMVLILFIPLIISSGGNSGSQASTLIIRAMALGQVRLRDWWRVMKRELSAGFSLGLFLAAIGMLRVVIWQAMFQDYGDHYLRVGIVISLSLLGVVMWGTLLGSMLPLLLRKLGFDPASASTPFVATLVDVFGIVIYINIARVLLAGTLL
jgi:magnesium transporter